jgi:hypothetical protein
VTRARPTLITAACATIAIVALGFLARPIADGNATRVVALRAGGGDVPSNVLRLYVELSTPMEPGSAYEHIHVLDNDGREIHDALLELREELWSPDHRRLTLLFDPGRVKRGIRANVEMGPPLVAGHRYRLVIDSLWRDARNLPLRGAFTQELRVAGFDSVSPDPARWSISAPPRYSHDTLRVGFGEALDHALAIRLISVVDARGARIPGAVTLSADDREWYFIPAGAWQDDVRLRVEPALEDLAGNNLVRPFDSDRARAAPAAEAAAADTNPRIIPVQLSSRA